MNELCVTHSTAALSIDARRGKTSASCETSAERVLSEKYSLTRDPDECIMCQFVWRHLVIGTGAQAETVGRVSVRFNGVIARRTLSAFVRSTSLLFV